MHKVKCFFCGQTFDRDKIDCVQVSSRRYAHSECYKNKEQYMTDEQRLHEYLKKLFHVDKLNPRVFIQIKDFVDKGMTYDSIQKTMQYFYEVKGNSISKANEGIGIVPYVCKEAGEYYYTIWMAQQKNKELCANHRPPKEIKICIKPPRTNVAPIRLIDF